MKEFIHKKTGQIVLVDDEDSHWLEDNKWYITNKEYVSVNNFALHRLVMGCVSGDNIVVDHINHNTLDNRKCNLRKCTFRENLLNSKGKPNHRSTPYKGVFPTSYNSYIVKIKNGNTETLVGTYKNLYEAAIAYNNAAIENFGEYAYLNELTYIDKLKMFMHGKSDIFPTR